MPSGPTRDPPRRVCTVGIVRDRPSRTISLSVDDISSALAVSSALPQAGRDERRVDVASVIARAATLRETEIVLPPNHERIELHVDAPGPLVQSLKALYSGLAKEAGVSAQT
jgi:hypothetical protein